MRRAVRRPARGRREGRGRVRPALPGIAPLLLPALILAGAAGCSGLLDTSRGDVPDEARVILDGTAEEELELVVSNDFVRLEGGSGSELLTSDTLLVSPSFEEAYGFGARRRFLVRLANPDGGEADVTLSVYFDDELRYERPSDLADETLEFNFIFR